MVELWGRPSSAKRGYSQRATYEAIGRALMAWEEIEGAFAHLHSAFLTGEKFNTGANREYGEPPNFVQRVERLKTAACCYFIKCPCQDVEGRFNDLVRHALGWSLRRNDVAHGRARPSSWIIDGETQGKDRWCIVPAHFRGDKFPDNHPAYVLSSRQIRRFADAFWELAHQVSDFGQEIEKAQNRRALYSPQTTETSTPPRFPQLSHRKRRRRPFTRR
jgi:hypothetical protein